MDDFWIDEDMEEDPLSILVVLARGSYGLNSLDALWAESLLELILYTSPEHIVEIATKARDMAMREYEYKRESE